jgi:hypothetical protein
MAQLKAGSTIHRLHHQNPSPPVSLLRTGAIALMLGFGIAAAVQVEPDTQYVRIIIDAARVHSDIDSRSATVGIAKLDEKLVLLDYTEEAFKVLFHGQNGVVEAWVDRNSGEIIAAKAVSTIQVKKLLLPAGIGAVALLVLILAIVSGVRVARRMRERAASKLSTGKTIVVVAEADKDIRYSLTNAPSTIVRCFSEVGFSVLRAKTAAVLAQRIRHRTPEVVLVDWAMGAGLADEIESVMAGDVASRQVPLIYYNAPQSVAASRTPKVKAVYYLGTELSDRDVFKIIQPHSLGSSTQTTIQRKGAGASGLEGDISDASGLSAVLQLIEIGQKTGALMISQGDKPVGMMCFESGNPAYAATSANKGEKAIYELLDLTSGQFKFTTDTKGPERNCAISTMGALMEWSRVKDESGKH